VANAPASVGDTFVADPQRTNRTLQGTNETVAWIEVTPVGNSQRTEVVSFGFDTSTDQVLVLNFISESTTVWGCLGAFPPGCPGASVNRTAGTLTLANVVLTATSSSNLPPPITLNGTLSFTPF
jgi:hypothetical protein